MNKNKKYLAGVLIFIGVLALISLAIGIFSQISFLESFRIIFGSVYVLFLPGFILTYIFFPLTKKFDDKNEENGAIDWIERIALSFALSIAIVPLVVFYLNLIGVKISVINSFFTIISIIIISLGILFWKRKKHL